MEEGKGGATVLTGATGFLGGHLLAALVARGEPVTVLGRPNAETGLSVRIGKLLDWFGLEFPDGRVETVEADLRIPGFGLPEDRYEALGSRTGRIIHCASDTRFSERKRGEITDANMGGLQGVLALARACRPGYFHYVSTAFVAGDNDSICREGPVDPGGFANVYEETKARAERQVAEQCRRHGVPFTIMRPSVVYGDSRSGRSTRFNALYYHVRSLLNIREIYKTDILENGGRRSAGHGIHLDGNGVLRLPLRVFLPKRGSVNLIPVDYFVSAVLSILARPEDGGVYHLTSDKPRTMEELTGFCEAYLKIRGIEIVYGETPDGKTLNPAEALFDRFIEPYRPYLADTRVFERDRTHRTTGGLDVPELTGEVFEKCMDYAVSVDWNVDI